MCPSLFFSPRVFCIQGGESILEQEKKRKEGVSDLQKLPTITTVSPVYTYYNQNSFHMAFFWCRNGRRIRRTQAVRSYWVGWKGESEMERDIQRCSDTTRIAIRPPGVCSGAARATDNTTVSSSSECDVCE